jgi:hypothetical protein
MLYVHKSRRKPSINEKLNQNEGIILITSKDPISTMFINISQLEYSLIGTYLDDTIKIKYIFNNQTPHWSANINTFEQFEQLSHIEKIIKIPYSKKSSLGYQFSNEKIKSRELVKILLHDPFNLPAIKFPVKNSNNLIDHLNDNLDLSMGKMVSIHACGDQEMDFSSESKYLYNVMNELVYILIPYYKPNQTNNKVNNSHNKPNNSGDNKTNNNDRDSSNNGDNQNNISDSDNNQTNNNQTNSSDNSSDDSSDNSSKDSDMDGDSGEFYHHIKDITDNLDNNITPVIDLKLLINTANTLKSDNQADIILNKSENSSCIVTLKPTTKLKLNLKLGNHITLSSINYDLSVFTETELKEILDTLNYSCQDSRYDNLKSDIISQISQM